MRKRLWSAASAVLILSAAVIVITAAASADGYNKTRTELLDEGVFVTFGNGSLLVPT